MGPSRELERILEPISLSEFLEAFYEKAALHISGRGEDLFRGIFDRAAAEKLLWQCEEQIPLFVRMSKGGHEIELPRAITTKDYARWTLERYFEGWTIVMNGVEKRVPSVAQLARHVEACFGGNVSVNALLTPPNSEAFLPHFDTREGFIFQLEGEKRWRLYHTPVILPMFHQGYVLDPTTIGAPTLDVVLRPGDLLYVPRGVVHVASALDAGSLHLTFGFRPKRWVDVLLSALEIVADEEVALRRSILESSRSPTDDEISRVLTLLANRFHDSQTLERGTSRHERRFVNSLRVLPESLALAFEEYPALASDDLVERRDGMICHVDVASEDRVRISFPGLGLADTEETESGSVEGPLAIHPALRFIACARGPFCPRELPGLLSENAKVVLVCRLIREGLLWRRSAEPARSLRSDDSVQHTQLGDLPS